MRRAARAMTIALAVTIAAAAAGCSRDSEVLGFVNEFDAFSSEIVKKVKTAPNPDKGVDAAQAYLDQNKASIRQKLAAIKEVRAFQISGETKKKMQESLVNSATAVAGLEIEYVTQMATNDGFGGSSRSWSPTIKEWSRTEAVQSSANRGGKSGLAASDSGPGLLSR